MVVGTFDWIASQGKTVYQNSFGKSNRFKTEAKSKILPGPNNYIVNTKWGSPTNLFKTCSSFSNLKNVYYHWKNLDHFFIHMDNSSYSLCNQALPDNSLALFLLLLTNIGRVHECSWSKAMMDKPWWLLQLWKYVVWAWTYSLIYILKRVRQPRVYNHVHKL